MDLESNIYTADPEVDKLVLSSISYEAVPNL